MLKYVITLLLLTIQLNLFSQKVVTNLSPTNSRAINYAVKNVDLDKYFTDYELISFDVNSIYRKVQREEFMSLNLPFSMGSTQPNVIIWKDHALLDDLRIATTNGEFSSINSPIALRGYEKETNKNVRLTINKDFIYGYVNTKGGVYFIEPLNYYNSSAKPSQYIIYNAEDVIFSNENHCGALETKRKMNETTIERNMLAGDCYEVELSVASDYSMFQRYNNVTGVVNHNVGVMNNVQGNYDDDFADEIQFNIVEQYVSDCSNCDPWTSSNDASTVLSSFTNWGPNGFSETHDLGQFWTARDFDGSTIGIAWVGVVCGSNRYHALSDFSSNANLMRVMVAHEIGHNFNASHDNQGDPWIMAPSVQNTNTWSSASTSAIQNHYNSRNCLAQCADPLPPEADFFAPIASVCAGSPVQFFDASINNPTTWSWSFDGGTPNSSFLKDPIVTYNNPGTYPVELTVTSQYGADTNIKYGYISVDNSGATDFLLLDDFSNGLVNWTVINNDNDKSWESTSVPGSRGDNLAVFINNFDYNASGELDGLQSIPFDLSGRSSANIEIEYAYARYNSSNSDKFRIKVSTDGGQTFPNILFVGQENGNGSFATRPDDQEAFYPAEESDWCTESTFTNGCISVSLDDYLDESNVVILLENECGYGNNLFLDNVWITASCQIIDPPLASFSGSPTTGCVPTIVQYTDQSSNNPTEWIWEFEGGSPTISTDQNPEVVYVNSGSFNVSLTVTNSAGSNTVSYTNYIVVNDVPETNFTYEASGSTYQFLNTSIGTDLTYIWDFGDGTSSADQNPIHTYTIDGNYTVTLRATNECGYTEHSETINIQISAEADFTSDVTNGCADLVVQFSDNSTNATTYNWIFYGGVPATSSLANPSVVYSEAGEYDVELIVSNGFTYDTITKSNFIQVYDIPQASFTVTSNDLIATFTNTSLGATTYSWDFGDGQMSTETNPIHVYDVGGSYTVELTAFNECGEAIAEGDVFITDLPIANFNSNATSGCVPFEVNFNDASSSNVTSWFWTFEGGEPSTSAEQNPTVNYSVGGVYDVSLIVTNSSGTDEIIKSDYITVGLNPIADFTQQVNPDGTIQFTNLSQHAESYLWLFGDNTTSTEENPSHQYNTDGNYTVTLIVTNSCGSATISNDVNVVTQVIANASANITAGCASMSINFSNLSSTNATTFEWKFEGGNPAFSTEENPTVIYNQAGVYDVILVANNSVFSDTLYLNNYVEVYQFPTVDFSFDINNTTVDFNNLSNNSDSYQWSFGDGTFSNEENPVHNYAQNGQYEVTLEVQNSCGTVTITKVINVSELPTADFTVNHVNICVGENVTFMNSSTNDVVSYFWEFEGGNPTTSSEENPVVQYTSEGVFDVKLTVTNAAGSSEIVKEDYIVVNGLPVADFEYSVNGSSVTFSNISQNASSYQWDIETKSTTTEENPMVTFDQNGEYTVKLTATNSCGSTELIQTITIIGYPNVSINASNTSGCNPLTVVFEDLTNGEVVDRLWHFPGGTPNTSSESPVTVVYNNPGTFNVELEVTNEVGESTLLLENYINVYETPVVDFQYDIVENTVNFTGQFDSDVTVYWDFGDFNISNETNPVNTYTNTGVYQVYLTIIKGECSTTIVKEVNIEIIANHETNISELILYPNPNDGTFAISAISTNVGIYDLKIINSLGQYVYIEHDISASSPKSLNLDLANGMYLIEILNEKGYKNIFKMIVD